MKATSLILFVISLIASPAFADSSEAPKADKDYLKSLAYCKSQVKINHPWCFASKGIKL